MPEPTVEPIKKRRGPKPGFKRKPRVQSIVEGVNGEPNGQIGKGSHVEAFSEEHPVIKTMAEEWEALDGQIEALKDKQRFLESIMEKCRRVTA